MQQQVLKIPEFAKTGVQVDDSVFGKLRGNLA
jgi:hypothetical protein